VSIMKQINIILCLLMRVKRREFAQKFCQLSCADQLSLSVIDVHSKSMRNDKGIATFLSSFDSRPRLTRPKSSSLAQLLQKISSALARN
jgi:hypothetical protein